MASYMHSYLGRACAETHQRFAHCDGVGIWMRVDAKHHRRDDGMASAIAQTFRDARMDVSFPGAPCLSTYERWQDFKLRLMKLDVRHRALVPLAEGPSGEFDVVIELAVPSNFRRKLLDPKQMPKRYAVVISELAQHMENVLKGTPSEKGRKMKLIELEDWISSKEDIMEFVLKKKGFIRPTEGQRRPAAHGAGAQTGSEGKGPNCLCFYHNAAYQEREGLQKAMRHRNKNCWGWKKNGVHVKNPAAVGSQ